MEEDTSVRSEAAHWHRSASSRQRGALPASTASFRLASSPDLCWNAGSKSNTLKEASLTVPEYALSIVVLVLGWAAALFGIAGQVRPAGLTAFAITTAAGLGFVAFSWLIYGSNIQTLMWVADLMEDRVLHTRENWKNQSIRSLVEVGSWLHITFRIFALTESALVAAIGGSLVGAFCVVVGEYFSHYTRAAEQRLETGYSDYRQYLRRLSSGAQSEEDFAQNRLSETPIQDNLDSRAHFEAFGRQTRIESGQNASQQPVIQPCEPRKELASVFATPQCASLVAAFAFSFALFHVKESEDLGLAALLTTLTNVAFITSEQLLMLWRPTRWAALILHDRVMNVVSNWRRQTIRSGFETCFYLSSIFSCYALTESVPFAVVAGTVAGIVVILLSSWIGIGFQISGVDPLYNLTAHGGNQLERSLFLIAIAVWAIATFRYAVIEHSRVGYLALGLVIPTGISIMCLAELAATTEGMSRVSMFFFVARSMFWPFSSTPSAALCSVDLREVLETQEQETTRDTARLMFSNITNRIVERCELRGKPWVLVDGYVFDVSSFCAVHPGGEALLYNFARRQADVSDQFAAFHKPETYSRLRDLLVGKMQEQTPCEQPCSEQEAAVQEETSRATEEFRKLRRHLWRAGYFSTAERDPTIARRCALRMLFIVFSGALVLLQVIYLSHRLVDGNKSELLLFLQSISSGTTLALFWTQVQSFAHDALHNSVVSSICSDRQPRSLDNVLGWSLSSVLAGVSSVMWTEQHNTHHACTMQPQMDVQYWFLPFWCISTRDFDTRAWLNVRDVAFFMPRLMTALVSVQTFTFVPGTLLFARLQLQCSSIIFALRHQVFHDLIGIAVFWGLYTLLVSQLSSHKEVQLLFIVSSYLVAGVSDLCARISHVATWDGTHADHDRAEFFTAQVLATRNIHLGCGQSSSNYAIEHHLFPLLPRHRFHLIQSAVRELCERHNIPYRSCSPREALTTSLKHLHELSAKVQCGDLEA
eukprot:CAMPEP_0184544436 /NCGR_PEP_ID=MMETSP0199_2-20130426/3632_1 /TAXON_ID=1112570 /ORGANISM="Thraustochytrium sp., Strain LLF1b" /LENGTH=989 /DNA_ID=CAMNT_0026938617 /DNA_START=3 /DNA_END=2972 /DNA_ORIENTATION=-